MRGANTQSISNILESIPEVSSPIQVSEYFESHWLIVSEYFESHWLIVTRVLNTPAHQWLRLLLQGKHTRFLAGYSTISNQQNCLLSKQDSHPPHRRALQMPVPSPLPCSQHLALVTLTPWPFFLLPFTSWVPLRCNCSCEPS